MAAPPEFGHRVDGAPALSGRAGAPLPDALRASVERKSGFAMHDVRVHYDSPRPARLLAAAYTQGADIHIAPGKERHLPHEAWHAVQQKQHRVLGSGVREDAGLEREATERGAQAAPPSPLPSPLRHASAVADAPIQRALDLELVGQYLAAVPRGGELGLEVFADAVSRDSKRYNAIAEDKLRERRAALGEILDALHKIDFHELSGGTQTAVDKLLRLVHAEIDAVHLAQRAAEEQEDEDEAPPQSASAQQKGGETKEVPKKSAVERNAMLAKLVGGLVVTRVDAYHVRVKQLEAGMGAEFDPAKLIQALYEASMMTLLPELKKFYPVLKIEGDDPTFSRSRWCIEIPDHELISGETHDLKKISTEVFHETRHIEQAWLEAIARKQSANRKSDAQLAGETEVPTPMFKKLIAAPYPKSVGTKFMEPIVATTQSAKLQHKANMEEHGKLRQRQGVSREEQLAYGITPLDSKEEARLAALEKAYREYPREADAYRAEQVYSKHYDNPT